MLWTYPVLMSKKGEVSTTIYFKYIIHCCNINNLDFSPLKIRLKMTYSVKTAKNQVQNNCNLIFLCKFSEY